MANENKEQAVIEHSPDKLLEGFSKGRILLWATVAVVIHVVLIGSTSIGYIRDQWIDPDGATARKQAAAAVVAAATPVAKKQPAKQVVEPQKAPSPAPENSAATPPPAPGGTDAKLLEEHKDAPVVKRITDKPAPGEQPKAPDDIGISIEETNKK